MLKRLADFIWGCFKREPVRLAIVRKYVDANGAYVGELYLYDTIAQKNGLYVGYSMIGASLDTLPLGYTGNMTEGFILDAEHDFLRLPMPPNVVRVGGLTPLDDIRVRRDMYKLRHRPIELIVQNRFIEHILTQKEGK
jgi:hypothetical protein